MRGHTDAFGKFGVVLIVLLLVAAPVAAQASILVDGFEDGTITDDWTEQNTGDFASFTPVNNVSAVGDWSLRVDGTGSLDTIEKTFTGDAYESASFYYNTTGSNFNSISFSDGLGSSTSVIAIRYNGGEFQANGGGSFLPVASVPPGDWYRVVVTDINYTAETYDVEIRAENGTVLGSGTGYDFATPGHTEISAVSVTQASSVKMWIDEIIVGELPEPGQETSLELEIRDWMPFDSTQDYRVYLNQTNTTSGDTNLTDVTADANVTIYNVSNTTSFSEPIATVNNTSDTIRSYNQTGVVAVNATYDGTTLGNASNLTVGNRNLSNIGIMPPSQWIPSFFGVDDTTGGHNIGSATQWILFIIVVMAAAARMFDNPWAGLGGGMVTGILMWVLTFVGLGVVLATVFSTIFVGLLVLRSRRMSVNVGGP